MMISSLSISKKGVDDPNNLTENLIPLSWILSILDYMNLWSEYRLWSRTDQV